MKDTPWDALVTTGACALLFLLACGWQRAVVRSQRAAGATESWQHARERFPMPNTFVLAADVPDTVLQAVVRANPFSPQRHHVPQVTPGLQGSSAQVPPLPPAQFVYKGRIVMGATQRAVLEEASTRKTYFLQRGQEVAGFKVLDIAENRVVLSDVRTQEEVVVPLAVRTSP